MTIGVRNTGSGRWSLTPSGSNVSFTVFGSQTDASIWAARLDITYRSLGVQMASGLLSGREIVLVNSRNVGRGSFVPQHGRDSFGTIVNKGGPDGTIYINFDRNSEYANVWGNSAAGEVAAILAHEILHAAYGSHSWGGGQPPSWQAVYADRYYEQQFSLAAELRLAFSINVSEFGLTRGNLVVSEYGLRVPASQIQTDAQGRRYYSVSSDGRTRTYYIVDHETYLKLGAKLVAAGRSSGSNSSGIGVGDFVYSGTEAERLYDKRQIAEISRAIKAESYGAFGSLLGSSIGSYLANGNVGLGVIYSSVIGEIGERLALNISQTGTGNIPRWCGQSA